MSTSRPSTSGATQRGRRHAATVALLLALCAVVGVGRARAGDAAAAMAARHGFSPDVLGYILFDAASGKVLAEHRADEPFIPASTTKITTALAALEILGSDFRFATTLLATGTIGDGTLLGGLYLRGGGDPTLSSDDLRTLVGELRRAGVSRVAGGFFFDESLYPRSAEIDVLQPEAAPYNPAVSALSVNYNRIELRWRRAPGAPHTTAEVFSPADGGALPLRGITTGPFVGEVDPRIEFVFAPQPGPRWLLSPRLAPSGTAFLPVKGDSGPVVAELFATLARQAGIRLPEPGRADAPADAREIARHESAPLTTVVEGLLRYSNNLTAELTGLAASYRLAGEGLALEPSAQRLAAWWQDRLPETSFRGFVAANHSGLSSVTRHSPRQMAAILRYGRSGQASGARLQELLHAREIADQGANGAHETTVRAKTGTLLYADGLVGFLTSRDGRELGFAILLTDLDARARLDAGRDVRISVSPPEATDWTARAKALERDLVARWTDDGAS